VAPDLGYLLSEKTKIVGKTDQMSERSLGLSRVAWVVGTFNPNLFS
jgi:hypothetical protein